MYVSNAPNRETNIETWRLLPREVRMLIAARFVNRVGAFALPFLTLFLTRTLGASTEVAGLLVAGFGVTTMVSRLVGGWLADRWGRRSTLLTGLLGCAVALGAIATSPNLVVAAVAVALLGLSFELYESPTQAMIADTVASVDRPAAFGMLGAALSAAAVIAGILAMVVAAHGMRLLFAADGGTCLAAAIVVRRRVPSAPLPSRLAYVPQAGRGPWREPAFASLFITNTIFAICYVQVFVSLPLTLRSHGIGPAGLGMLLTVSAVVVILGQPLVRRTRGRLRTPRFALGVGFAMVAIGFAGYGVATTPTGFVAATLVCSLGEVLLMGHLVASVCELAPPLQRARYLAAFGLSWGLAMTLGPPAGGWLLQHGGNGAVWFAAAGGCMVVALRLGFRCVSELSTSTTDHLHRIIAERQSKHRVPGIAAGVARDGELIWSGGVGAADITKPDEPPTEDTQFLVASNTKMFTAVLVMALRDEGKLDLADPVDKFIPESKHPGVTIRQMLSHVTGMQREPVGDVWDTLRFPDRTELIDGWNQAERILKPHYKWHYSNVVYSVLGEIIARIDGREWSESLQARILDPLEMRRTTVGLAGNVAVGYYVPPFSDVPVVERVMDFKAMAPAGSLASTIRDMATWGSFLADPTDEVLGKDTVDEMCQPQIMADLEGWQLAWGLGLMLRRHEDRIWVGHEGGNPGHITGLFVQRQSKTVGIALMNSMSAPDPAALALELGGYVLHNEPSDPEPWRPGTEVPAELEGILGRWFSEGSPFTFSVRAGHLEARGDGAPATRPPSVFVKLADDLFRTESGRETGELLRVTRDDAGAVVRMNWATYRFTREPLAFGEWL